MSPIRKDGRGLKQDEAVFSVIREESALAQPWLHASPEASRQ